MTFKLEWLIYPEVQWVGLVVIALKPSWLPKSCSPCRVAKKEAWCTSVGAIPWSACWQSFPIFFNQGIFPSSTNPPPHQAINQCDVCDSWFHAKCCKLPSIYIDLLSRSSCIWLGPKCGRSNSKPYSSDSEVLPSSLNYFEPLFNSGILPSNSNKPDSSKWNNNRRTLKDVPKNNRRKLICMTMNCRSAKTK